MKRNRSSQVAMEFLITHGWAFLVVFLVILALTFFGMFDINNYTPEKAEIEPGITVKDMSVNENTVVLVVKNNKGKDIRDFQVNVTACTGGGTSYPVSLPEGSTKKIEVWCGSTAPPESRFKSNLEVKYKTSNRELGLDEYVDHAVQGLIAADVIEGITIDYSGCDELIDSCKTSGWEAGKVYCLTTNIEKTTGTCMSVFANDITLDGKGFKISSSNSRTSSNNGLIVSGMRVTIANLNISNYYYGITIYGREVNISHVSVESNYLYAMKLYSALNVTLDNVQIEDSGTGLSLDDSDQVAMDNVAMKGNIINFDISGVNDNDFIHDIDTSNTVDNKILYYNHSISAYDYNLSTAPNAGAVYCALCDDIEVKGLNLSSNNSAGVMFYKTTNSIIRDTFTMNNQYGILIEKGSDNIVLSALSFFNDYGIKMYQGNDNLVSNSVFFDNDEYGIYIDISDSNTITDTVTSSNRDGIQLKSSMNNRLDNVSVLSNSRYGAYLVQGSSPVSGNVFRYTNISDNLYANFHFAPSNSENSFANDIDTTNIVDSEYILYYNHSLSGYDYNPITAPDAGAIYCLGCNDISFEDLDLSHRNGGGIFIMSGDGVDINNVVARQNIYGMYLNCSDVSVTNITVISNSNTGLYLKNLSSGFIDSAVMNYNSYGMRLESSVDVELGNSNFTGNAYNFFIDGSSFDHYNHIIHTTNRINTFYRLYYNISLSGYVFDPASSPFAASVFCINCINVLVKDLELNQKNSHGVLFYDTSNSEIRNVNSTNRNINGIMLYTGSNNDVIDVNVSGNTYGIQLLSTQNNDLENVEADSNTNTGLYMMSSTYNDVKNLNASNNFAKGLLLTESSKNNLSNIIADYNSYGIYLSTSSDNNFTDASFSENTYTGVYIIYNSGKNRFNDVIANSNKRSGISFESIYSYDDFYFSGTQACNNVLYDLECNANTEGTTGTGNFFKKLSSNNDCSGEGWPVEGNDYTECMG